MSGSMRIWGFASAIVMIVLIALGWFLGIAPKLAEAARFDDERLAVQAQNEATRVIIAGLEADFEKLDELREQLSVLRAEFPNQVEYDTATEEFVTSLLAEGLTLESLVLAEPGPASAAVLEGDEAAADTDAAATGDLPAGSLLQVSVTVVVQGSLSAALGFIDALQQSPRFVVMPAWTYTADDAGGSTTITFSIYVVTGEDLVGVPTTAPTEPTEPQPTETPTPEATDPAATATPTPTPTP